MSYRLEYRRPFEKELRRLPQKIRQAVVKRILSLANNPRPHGVEKLQGSLNQFRVRQGDYRIIYSVHDDILVIELIKVGHRGDVYRKR